MNYGNCVLYCFSHLRLIGPRYAGDSATAGDDTTQCVPTVPPQAAIRGLDANEWMAHFAADVRKLATEILIHICGDSCFKYSGAKMTQICRHGFYHVVSIEDYQRRRKGKALRNAVFVVRQTKHGMKGRLLLFQEHPFELSLIHI